MSLPYFPMFPTDFDADTGHLSFAEDGAYNRLLRLSWKCPGAKMPDDMDWIHRRARAVSIEEKALVASIIAEFFTRSGGKIFSTRLAKEWQKSSLAHSKRVLAGSAGGKAKALKTKKSEPSNAVAKPYQPEPEPEPYKEDREPIGSLALIAPETPSRFDEFWQQYPHRNGAKKGKAKAQQSWARSIKAGASPDQIIAGAMRYAGDRQVIDGYAKDPTTWLNAKGWEDEIERSNNQPRPNPSRAESGTIAAFAAVAARRIAASGGN